MIRDKPRAGFSAARLCPYCGKLFWARSSDQRQAAVDARQSLALHIKHTHAPTH